MHCAVLNKTPVGIKKMQNNTVNGADGESDQTADVRFCKNWYVLLIV